MIKRSFDVIFSFFGIVLILPLFVLIAGLIKVKMPGPVLFRQLRTGRHGIPFSICKFRTMTLNHNGSSVSVKGESRITPLGAILRRSKLDELPELWNVLIGEMSFVGPRPDMPEYASSLVGEERLILEIRPGITGPASIKYNNEEELLSMVDDPEKYSREVLWPDKVRINLDYYYNRSFFGDIMIIFRTIFRSIKK